ncbi:MAG: SDR family NAD(P)-dependent oxidoreductase [Hyphomicrobiaceae bacterium]
MQFDFKGKRVVVCGGSRGIGRATAETFARDGAAVAICARGKAGLDEAAAALGRHGGKVHAGVCDLANGDQVKAYVTAAGEALGGIDVLVNNASGFGHTDDETGWAASLNIDVLATVRASHAALPFLEKAGGVIINISSISGFAASTRSAPYAAVKAAINNYTSSQALALAPKKIRVNAIAPGSIEFPGGVWDQRKTQNPNLYNATLKSIPWGRMGHAEEIANVAAFLASDLASWVTGQTLVVDGGQLLG